MVDQTTVLGANALLDELLRLDEETLRLNGEQDRLIKQLMSLSKKHEEIIVKKQAMISSLKSLGVSVRA